jgi:hypothetical protein
MTTAIKSRLIIDGTGASPIHHGVVLVDGDRILDVGREADLGIPDDAEVIDLGDETTRTSRSILASAGCSASSKDCGSRTRSREHAPHTTCAST